jgi:hypothetical protein
MGRRKLDFDDVGAELRRDLRRIGHHVDRRLAFFGDRGSTWIRPDHHGESAVFRFFGDGTQLFVHHMTMGRTGIDREPHGHAAQSSRIFHAARHRWQRILVVMQDVMIVQL